MCCAKRSETCAGQNFDGFEEKQRYWSNLLKNVKPRKKDLKDFLTFLHICISFLRKGEVLAYVERIHNLKDLKDCGRVRCSPMHSKP